MERGGLIDVWGAKEEVSRPEGSPVTGEEEIPDVADDILRVLEQKLV